MDHDQKSIFLLSGAFAPLYLGAEVDVGTDSCAGACNQQNVVCSMLGGLTVGGLMIYW